MKEKEKYFIDLSKCSESERKHIFSLLPEPKAELHYEVTENFYFLHFNKNNIWFVGDYNYNKNELTYPDFIKLFEGGETIKSDQTQIEKLEAEKKELLEALVRTNEWCGKFGLEYEIYHNNESLIKKHKQ